MMSKGVIGTLPKKASAGIVAAQASHTQLPVAHKNVADTTYAIRRIPMRMDIPTTSGFNGADRLGRRT